MTATEFRRLALALPGAIESSHMAHPDFRAGGKIFATLGYPDDAWGMVKLTPELQRQYMRAAPAVFAPCAGAWGLRGATTVRLSGATLKLVRPALAAAHANVGVLAEKSRPRENARQGHGSPAGGLAASSPRRGRR